MRGGCAPTIGDEDVGDEADTNGADVEQGGIIRVSAVITAFRRADTVVEAIQSVLDQTYPVHEVIVVDDASGDGTPDAIRSVTDPRVRLVQLSENRGPAGAMNAGILAATGDVVALLDSDDLWIPEKVATQLAVWQARADRDSILLCTRVFDEVDDVIVGTSPDRLIAEGDRADDYLFIRNGLIQTGTMMLTAKLAKDVLFDGATRRHIDPGFVMRLMVQGVKIVQLEEPLTRWRSASGAARVSRTANLDSSLHWLKINRPLMTPRAVIAFRYRNHIRILRRTDRKQAALLTARAVAAGVLGWRDVAKKIDPLLRRLRPGTETR